MFVTLSYGAPVTQKFNLEILRKKWLNHHHHHHLTNPKLWVIDLAIFVFVHSHNHFLNLLRKKQSIFQFIIWYFLELQLNAFVDQFYWLNTNTMFNLIGKNLDFLFQLDRSDGKIFVAMWWRWSFLFLTDTDVFWTHVNMAIMQFWHTNVDDVFLYYSCSFFGPVFMVVQGMFMFFMVSAWFS